MTYYLCSRDHYVQQHRGETLSVGDTCPARDCGARLRPAPESDEVQTCPSCNRGLLLETDVDGVDSTVCSFCAARRDVPASSGGSDVVTKPKAKTGAQRVAEHRARKRAQAK